MLLLIALVITESVLENLVWNSFWITSCVSNGIPNPKLSNYLITWRLWLFLQFYRFIITWHTSPDAHWPSTPIWSCQHAPCRRTSTGDAPSARIYCIDRPFFYFTFSLKFYQNIFTYKNHFNDLLKWTIKANAENLCVKIVIDFTKLKSF